MHTIKLMHRSAVINNIGNFNARNFVGTGLSWKEFSLLWPLYFSSKVS